MKTIKTLIRAWQPCLLLNAAASRTAADLKTNTPVRSCCAAMEMPDTVPAYTDKSLYQVESTWTTDAGKPIKLGDLAGKPQVVLMFFSRCTYGLPDSDERFETHQRRADARRSARKLVSR